MIKWQPFFCPADRGTSSFPIAVIQGEMGFCCLKRLYKNVVGCCD